jgi:hypothetical protein
MQTIGITLSWHGILASISFICSCECQTNQHNSSANKFFQTIFTLNDKREWEKQGSILGRLGRVKTKIKQMAT